MKRAAIYHRVSTVEQAPATIAQDLLRVLEAARRGRVDWVLVWKLDRWGRSALDLLSNVRELQRSGVRFVAVSQGLERFAVAAGRKRRNRSPAIERSRLRWYPSIPPECTRPTAACTQGKTVSP